MAEDTNVVLLLERVRLSYFYGYEGYESTDDNGVTKRSYPSHFIMTPGHPSLPKVAAAIEQAARAAWGEKAGAVLAQLKAQDRLCLHKGDTTKPGQDGYVGNWFISGNAKGRYTIIDGNRNPVAQGDANAPYSGCWANAIVSIYAQKGEGKQVKHGKRINCQIQGIQFVARGDSFGGGRVAQSDEFPVAADADGEAPVGESESSDLLS